MTSHAEIRPMLLGQLLPMITLDQHLSSLSVSGITVDSRNVMSGYVFVALKGVSSHGKAYMDQAIAQGAVVVLLSSVDGTSEIDYQQNIPVITIALLEQQLSDIAGRFYGHPSRSLLLTGITGTNGKTTCSQLYAQLSALMGHPAGVVGTLGYGCYTPDMQKNDKPQVSLTSTGMTTPDPVRTQAICAELLDLACDNIVMEVSSHALEQGRVSAMDFDVAILTNLSHDHLDFHGTMEAYGKAKSRLFVLPSVRLAVLNRDDPFSQQIKAALHRETTWVEYSLEDASADVFLSDIVCHRSSTTATLHTQQGVFPITTSLIGAFNLRNLLAVLSAFMYSYSPSTKTFFDNKRLLHHALSASNIAAVVSKVQHLTPIPGRMETIDNTVGRQVIVDFAHTPDALQNVLMAIRQQATGHIVCVFGCGGDRDKAKRAQMAAIAETGADRVIVTSDNPRTENPAEIIHDICQGFSGDHYQCIDDRQQAIVTAIQHAAVNDVVLIAGKGHEDYQIIGEKTYPFSDQQVARSVLQQMEAKVGDQRS